MVTFTVTDWNKVSLKQCFQRKYFAKITAFLYYNKL